MQTYGPSAPAPPITDTQAYRNFIDACRSPHTRYQYHKAIEYFMSYLRIPKQEYSKLLEPDPRIIQANIIDYIAFLRKSRLNMYGLRKQLD